MAEDRLRVDSPQRFTIGSSQPWEWDIELGEHDNEAWDIDSGDIYELGKAPEKSTGVVLHLTKFPPDASHRGTNIRGHLCYFRRESRDRSGHSHTRDFLKLSTLRKSEHVKISLRPHQLRALFLGILDGYRQLGGLEAVVSEVGLTVVDVQQVTILDGRERDVLEQLMQRDPHFWTNAADLDTTNAIEAMAAHRDLQRKKSSLDEFETHLRDCDWSEYQWQRFFQQNEWIFGYGLEYKYLRLLRGNADIGGSGVIGSGGSRVDFLFESVGDVRYTVLLDIKTPQASLLGGLYRKRAYPPGEDVAGGVSQLQRYLQQWTVQGSRSDENREEIQALTVDPKGVLVAGHTAQLKNQNQKVAFEWYRRNLRNPEIVTFDELYERAQHIVARADASADSEDANSDDVPF